MDNIHINSLQNIDFNFSIIHNSFYMYERTEIVSIEMKENRSNEQSFPYKFSWDDMAFAINSLVNYKTSINGNL